MQRLNVLVLGDPNVTIVGWGTDEATYHILRQLECPGLQRLQLDVQNSCYGLDKFPSLDRVALHMPFPQTYRLAAAELSDIEFAVRFDHVLAMAWRLTLPSRLTQVRIYCYSIGMPDSETGQSFLGYLAHAVRRVCALPTESCSVDICDVARPKDEEDAHWREFGSMPPW